MQEKNNAIWHTTENLEEIIKSNKLIAPSLSVNKKVNGKAKYGSQFIIFKPEILENVNKNTKLFIGDGGNKFTRENNKFNSLMEMLKDDADKRIWGYNELKFNKDLGALKYIKEVRVRQDEPKEILNLLKENNIKYTIYNDYRVRGFKKKR